MHRYLRASDFWPRERTWELVAWCSERGASEFTLAFLSAGEGNPAVFAEADALLRPFRRPRAPRTRVTVLAGQPRVQPVELWTLAPESLTVLRRLLPDGLFAYPAGSHPGAWFEDPAFYRDGELMLGVVSHEREGLLQLSDVEYAQLGARGFPSHARGEWI